MTSESATYGLKRLQLGDLGRIVTGKTPSTHDPSNFGGDIPFVTPSDMDGRRTISNTERYLTKNGANAVRSSIIPPGSVMVSCIGSDMGKVAIAGQECVTNQQINSIVVSPEHSALYLYYELLPRKEELRNLAGGGSAQPILNKGHFSQIPILVPPLPEQRAIASVLGALDDKIELNRKMNRTLEEMARAIFKSWFVDFDPVRRNMARRAGEEVAQSAGASAEIDALFPDSFEDSPLGKIPKGWRVETIADLAIIVGGGTPSTKDPENWNDGIHAWATPKDLSGLSVPVLLETERRVTDIGLSRISSGLLPPGTVLLSSRAPIGYLAIAEIPVAVNQGFIAMIPKPGIPNLYLLYWAEWAHDEIISRANGSTFQEISKRSFRPIPVIAPDDGVFGAFDHMVRLLFSRIVEAERETRTLVQIRDALLPKLISGEIRVKAADKMVEVQV